MLVPNKSVSEFLLVNPKYAFRFFPREREKGCDIRTVKEFELPSTLNCLSEEPGSDLLKEPDTKNLVPSDEMGTSPNPLKKNNSSGLLVKIV